MSITTLQQLTEFLQSKLYVKNGVTYIDLQSWPELPEAGQLVAYLGKSELTIDHAVLTPNVNDVTITGNAPFLADVMYQVRFVGTVVDRTVRLAMSATPASIMTWTFVSNFVPLPEYVTLVGRHDTGPAPSFFDSLLVHTPSFVDATFNDSTRGVQLGLTFSAIWDATTAPFDSFAQYIPGASSLSLAGTIDMEAANFPIIDLRAPIPGMSYLLGLVTLSDMYLRLRTEELSDVFSPGEGQSTIVLGGYAPISSQQIALEAPMLLGNFSWSFRSAPETRVSLADLDALEPFLDNNPLIRPAGLLFIQSWDLTLLELGIEPQNEVVQYLGARVSTHESWTTPVPMIVIRDIHISWNFSLIVPGSSGYLIGVGGLLDVGNPPVTLFAEASYPGFVIEAGLAPGSTISVTNAISYFTGITIPMEMTITRILLSAYTEAQEYTFETEVEGVFPYPVAGITYGLTNLTIYYTPNSLSAVFTISITLGGQQFTVRAKTPQGDGGWVFSGGLQPGTTFSVAEFVQSLFGWSVPDSVAGIVITDFFVMFDTKNSDYYLSTGVQWDYQILDYPFRIAAYLQLRRTNNVLSGFVKGSFTILDFAIAASYAFQPSSSTITFSISYKTLTLQASLLSNTKDGKTTRILQVRFPDVTLGDILIWLVGMAAPDLDFSLSAPWSVLNEINLKNLLLTVDLDTNDVTLLYAVNVNLVFMQLTGIGIAYDSKSGQPGVRLALAGRFLNQEYSIERGNALEWDVVNDPAPEVPASGPKLIDIEYLGFGQHISFSDTTALNSVSDVIKALRTQMQPSNNANQNPLATGNGSQMRFDRASHVLFGASFTVLEAVSVAVIFNDPYLYGIRLALAGERVGSLAGLEFELLYKKISDNVGVFKVELRVPEAFRQWEFGSVSITLPVIKVDIYTNGNFRVDLGFPKNGNFADSFTVQVFPFIGSGGFYFAYLTGETSERVPRITNGVFNPVIEAGLGLRVGLGKEIDKGILSGGISITVEGIVEGIVAWFTPYDNAITDANYYWIQGTIGIVGQLYGKVDFVVIKVSVSVRASITTTLTLEAYEPIVVKLNVDVEASASVTILFIDVSFSFSVTLEEEFVIGSKSTPPWVLAAGGGGTGGGGAAAGLRMQRTHYRPKLRRRDLLRGIHSTEQAASLARARRPKEPTLTDAITNPWPAVLVFPEKQEPALMLLPAFTVATPPDGSPAETSSQTVFLLFTENSIAPFASDQATRRRSTADHSARAFTPSAMPFNVLLQSMLRWAIYAVRGSLTGDVTFGDLALAYAELQQPEVIDSSFSYKNLGDFMTANFVYQISGVPSNYSSANPLSSTIFPMIPELSYGPDGSPAIDFATFNIVTPAYEENARVYYDQLSVDFTIDRAVTPPDMDSTLTAATRSDSASGDESMATLIFREYFVMLARASVQAALDVLGRYSYSPVATDSLQSIAAQFPYVTTTYTVRAGDTIPLICEMFGMTLEQFETLNPGVTELEPGQVVTVAVAVTPESIAAANQTAPLQTGTQLTLTNVLYQIAAGDSLSSIATRFGVASIGTVVAAPDNAANRQLLARGASLTIAQAANGNASFDYTSAAGDTLQSIAAWEYVRAALAVTDLQRNWYGQTIIDLNTFSGGSPSPNLDGVIETGTLLYVPSLLDDSDPATALQYTSRDGDTVALVAGYFDVMQNSPQSLSAIETDLQTLNPSLPWNNLPAGTTVKMPPIGRVVQGDDTFASIAALFFVAVTDLAGANSASTTILAPLAVLQIPSVTFAVAANDTIASIAAEFNFTIAEFAADVETVQGLFASPAAVPLTIPGVPSYDIDALSEAIVSQDQVNAAAAQVSRFLLDGLQMPDPNDDHFLAYTPEQLASRDETPVSLEALYVLTGQQMPTPQTLPFTVVFTKTDVSWIEFTDSVITKDETGEQLLAMDEEVARRNPAVDFTQPVAPGTLILSATLTELPIDLTQTMLDDYGASDDFDPKIISGPAALPLYDATPITYALSGNIHWQTAETLPYAGHPPGAGPAAGEPTLWLFSEALIANAVAGAPRDYALFTNSVADETESVIAPVVLYDWATAIDIRVAQIASATTGVPLANTYSLQGADPADRELMRELFTQLNVSPQLDATLYVLWSPNVDSNNNSGLASLPLDQQQTFILKTNLTTITSSGNDGMRAAGGASPDTLFAATIDEPASFIELLWEGCVTNSGGFTLHYAAADGSGLPDELFASTTETTLTLVSVLGTQSSESGFDRAIYQFNNCALVGDNIDPSRQTVFVEPAVLEPSDYLTTASVPPGNAGFDLTRENPELGADSPETPAELRTRTLFSLLGYHTLAGGAFAASNEGLPVSPAAPPGVTLSSPDAQPPSWYYRQMFAVAPLAASVLPLCPGLPLPSQDPYSGITPDVSLSVQLDFHDVYGNFVYPASPIANVDIPYGYIDEVVGLSQWPAIDATYSISGTQASPDVPLLAASIALRIPTYVPGKGNSFAQAQIAASSHLVRVLRAYNQISQPDVETGLTTSLNQAPDASPHFYPVERRSLIDFLAASYAFLGGILGETPATVAVSGSDTFLSVAQQFGTDTAVIDATLLSIGVANSAVPASSLFATVRIPLFHVVAAGDTLLGIASSVGVSTLSPAEIATQNQTMPMNAGVTIGAPLRSTDPLGAAATLSAVAAQTVCGIGSLATLAADRIGILTVGTVLTYSGKVETVLATTEGSESLLMVAGRFREEQGVAPTAADLGVSNADVPAMFVEGTVLQTDDYVIQPGDTFASLAQQYPAFTIDDLATAAEESPNIFAAGTSLFLLEKPALTPQAGDTLESIAITQGIGLDQLTVFNESTPLTGPSIFLPDRVGITASGFIAAPYVIGAGNSLDSIAQLFAETADAVADRNWQLRGVFVPQQTVSAGGADTTTTADDSLQSVFDRLLAEAPSLTRTVYVAAIAGTTTLLRSGALFIEPLPSTGSSTTTLQALAQSYQSLPALIAQANAALYEFLVAGVAVTVKGVTVTTAAGDTFDSLVQTFLLAEKIETSVAELATLNATAPMIAAQQRFLVPPNPVALVHDLDLGSPANFPGNPFRLVTELVIRRDVDCVTPDFRATESVVESRSAIAPYAVPAAGGGKELSLQTFAANFEAVLPSLKLAVGGGSLTQGGPREVWVVDFGPGGVESVDIRGQSPSFFALPPLSTSLTDQSGVPIRTFDRATGTLSSTSELTDFKAVDLDVWAGIFTSAVDLLLTAEYATPAYQQNAAAFNSIVGSKITLAGAISQGLTNILGSPSPAGVPADAQERLRQELLLSLSAGYSTDAVVQYPVTVASSFTTARFDVSDAPRLSGKPTALVYVTAPGDTIDSLAAAYDVPSVWIAELLGAVVRILDAGIDIEFNSVDYEILPDDTINSLIARVGATSYADFVANLATPNGFFLPYTTINIAAMSAALSAMTSGDVTFDTMVAWFGEPLVVIVANNQDRNGIFIVGATITYPGSPATSVVVTAANNTISLIAEALGVTAIELARALESTTGILAPAFVAVVVGFVPEHNLSSAKASLLDGSTTMNVLFNVKSDAKRKNLLLDLDYRINELEFDIETLPGTGGYQASQWLGFIIPMTAANLQPVDSQLGQVNIPLPLRGYPSLPLLSSQTGAPDYAPAHTIDEAKDWTYSFAYQYDDAAQDTIGIQATFNIDNGSQLMAAVEIDPFFNALAQFVSVYDGMQSVLTKLVGPNGGTPDPVVAQTLTTFATLVDAVATNWTWSNDLPTLSLTHTRDPRMAVAQEVFNYELTVLRSEGLAGTELTAVVLTLPDGGSPSPTSQFPDLSWKLPISDTWQPLEKGTPSATQIVYTFAQPVPAGLSIQFQLLFPALDVLTVENAISGAAIARNLALVPTAPTNEAFVYRTGQIAFATVYLPFLSHTEPISFVDGTLQQSLQNLFTNLLGPDATEYTIDVALEYGYPLVGTDIESPSTIVSLLPIAFLPATPYVTTLPDELYAAIVAWQASRPLPAGQAMYIVAVTVYSTLTPGAPLLQLSELYYV